LWQPRDRARISVSRWKDTSSAALAICPTGKKRAILPSARRISPRHQPEKAGAEKANLCWRFKSITPVQPSREKYSYFFFSEIVSILRRPASTRGAYRDRHDTRGGMRWTWLRRQTSGADTDGQVVWLWHPDADAKFATMRNASRG
jgi:hypothetical protein